jgi:hypothetical protein
MSSLLGVAGIALLVLYALLNNDDDRDAYG